MKRKLTLMLGLSIAAIILLVSLSGCTASTTGAAAASGQQAVYTSTANQQGIWVSGEGKVTVTPNIATLSVGVNVQASTVVNAQSQAATAMDKVITTLTSNGVDKKDIQTQNYSIQQINTPITVTTPIYNQGSGSTIMPILPPTTTPSQAISYQVSNSVTVTIRNIDKTGSIIDAVAAAGGNLIRIDGVSFSVDQPEQYYPQARQLAVKDAADKASQLAKLAGVTLGKATYISENSSNTIYTPQIAGLGAAVRAPTTSINPGQTDITVDVQLVYAIQ